MLCPKCRVGMEEMKRSYHKKRKWVCPVCGRVRMEIPRTKRNHKPRKGPSGVE